ncbi:FISUMP domain-containing protein [Flavobacterium aquidurense]|uniref:FISUMP domain-containing protein n=1 Tax=Flavobacterium aquidurense TaxID=362413 RepID=UPI003712D234
MMKIRLRLLQCILIFSVCSTISISCSTEKNTEEPLADVMPTIITQPAAPEPVCSGSGSQAISILVKPIDGAILKYVWRKNGLAIVNNGVIAGQSTPTLKLVNPKFEDAGNYDVVVSNGTSQVVSNTFAITIRDSNSVPTVVGAAGKTWMAYNLGSTTIASSASDYNSYGANFQWGRRSDGHELIRWKSNIEGSSVNSNSQVLSDKDVPDTSGFIPTPQSYISTDWRLPGNDNLWQGINGINNPCPCGFRLPTDEEFTAEIVAAGITNATSAFKSPLKLVMAGMRDGRNGILDFVGRNGYYWTSSLDGKSAKMRYFVNNSTASNPGWRSFGYSIRCIKN